MDKDERMMTIALAWLTLAGVFVRVWGLGKYYLSADEVLILMIAGGRNLAAVFHGTLTQAHPPGHFFLMHYLLKISRNAYFLKSSSLLPGFLLPAACYLLGKRVSGRAAGLAMAAAAALGYGPVLMSEIIRPYAALLLFLTLALASYAAYDRNGRRVHAVGYTLAMAGALAFHYSAVLAAAAAGGTWFLKLAWRRRPARDYVAWSLAHLPLVLMAAVFYIFHLSRITTSHASWMETYLSPGVAHSFTDLLGHAYTLFFFLFHPGIAWLMAPLTLLGFYALFRSGRGEWAVMAGLAFLITLALSLFDVYPLYGSRHDTFLFPFAAVLAGGAVQYLAEAATRMWERMVVPERRERLGATLGSAPLAGLLFLVLAMLLVGAGYSRSDFLRQMKEAKNTEFTITRAAYDEAFAYLTAHVKAGDRVLCPRQAGDYMRFAAWPERSQPAAPHLERMRYQGLEFYFDPELWMFTTQEELTERFRELGRAAPFTDGATVWIFNIGFGNGMLRQALSRVLTRGRVPVKTVERESAIIYGVPAWAVEQAVKDRKE